MCREYGLVCAGYKKDIFFDFEPPISTGEARFRRPLLTEEERQRMSQWLVSSVSPQSAHRLLSQIDDEGEKASASSSSSDHLQFIRGPFGVFRFGQDQAASPPSEEAREAEPEDTSASSSTPVRDLAQNSGVYAVPSEAPVSPWPPGLLESPFDQPEHDPGPAGLFSMMMSSGGIEDATLALQECQFPGLTSNAYFHDPIAPGILPPLPSASASSVSRDAVFLLQHYGSAVINLMTPFRHSKTPWHVLFLPQVKNSLAALTLGEDLNHASLCAFYGTLAISAFSLGGVSRSRKWLEQGSSYRQQAQEEAHLTLETAYNSPKVAKYKTTLIALLTMAQVAMFSGSRGDVEDYLLEAEQLIRLRGLGRRKSRKVRLLHHCYAFQRFFHESTFLCSANSSRRRRIRRAIEMSGLARYSQDSLTFGLPSWGNLDREMAKVKEREEAENDLHLERPGIWYATLYPEIFGIPETWVFLLSQAIRLGNEKEAAEQRVTPNPLGLSEFVRRAKAVERCINHLQLPSHSCHTLPGHQSEMDQAVLDNMLEALQHALSIYFYRRIYDVDSSILQQKVLAVRDCLLRRDCADSSVVHGLAELIWPAFIAACEAEDPKVQASFSSWFRSAAQRSGLSCFTDTMANIEKVWQEKRCANGRSVTWLDIMKHAQLQNS